MKLPIILKYLQKVETAEIIYLKPFCSIERLKSRNYDDLICLRTFFYVRLYIENDFSYKVLRQNTGSSETLSSDALKVSGGRKRKICTQI